MNRPTLAEAAQRVVDALIPQFLVGPNALIGATELNDAKDALVAALRREAQSEPDIEAVRDAMQSARKYLMDGSRDSVASTPSPILMAVGALNRGLDALEGKR
jgi:hypothetical protein